MPLYRSGSILAMQAKAQLVFCRLVSPEILQLVNGNATMVYVGKNMGFHTRTQTEIHELLCQFAQEGAKVLRLKGGDPFIFGRGGEEMQYLQERGIKVHTVPGVAHHPTPNKSDTPTDQQPHSFVSSPFLTGQASIINCCPEGSTTCLQAFIMLA